MPVIRFNTALFVAVVALAAAHRAKIAPSLLVTYGQPVSGAYGHPFARGKASKKKRGKARH